jgi:hypothetical protein
MGCRASQALDDLDHVIRTAGVGDHRDGEATTLIVEEDHDRLRTDRAMGRQRQHGQSRVGTADAIDTGTWQAMVDGCAHGFPLPGGPPSGGSVRGKSVGGA